MPLPPHKQDIESPSQEGTVPPLVLKVKACIDHYGMLSPGDRVLVGVSGGPDSVALLHILLKLMRPYAIDLGIAHLDHGLRPETAAQETAWVKRLAERLGVAFFSERLPASPKRGSLEGWLRAQRYGFFERTASSRGFSKIAVGHQANDNAEAVLLHLLRGSGLRGISGIPPIRDGRIIRPLICVARKEILIYLDRLGIDWLQDPTNMDVRFDRNRIRHQLIPLLESEYNANLVQLLNRTASICFEEDRWIDSQLQPLLKRSVAAQNSETMALHIEPLVHERRPAQRRIIRSALRQWMGDLQRFSAAHIEQILSMLPEGKRHHRLNLPRRVTVERTMTGLCFRRSKERARGRPQMEPTPDTTDYCHIIESAANFPETLVIPQSGLRLSFHRGHTVRPDGTQTDGKNQVVFDLSRLNFPLVVRHPKPGDRIAPFGMHGTQKLKKLFIDKKIPRPVRQRIPLLASGDTILWAVGVRRGAHAPVDEHTTQVLHIEAESIEKQAEPQPH